MSYPRPCLGGGALALIVAFNLFGLLLASVMLFVAWQHNPQGSFHDPEGDAVHWRAWLPVGLSWWFLLGLLPSLLVLCVGLWRSRSARLPRTQA